MAAVPPLLLNVNALRRLPEPTEQRCTDEVLRELARVRGEIAECERSCGCANQMLNRDAELLLTARGEGDTNAPYAGSSLSIIDNMATKTRGHHDDGMVRLEHLKNEQSALLSELVTASSKES